MNIEHVEIGQLEKRFVFTYCTKFS